MIVYKLVRKLKDGSLAPLFINQSMRYELGEWHKAEAINKKGYVFRPGFHCTLRPEAPHLLDEPKNGKRVWVRCHVRDYEYFQKPISQGGTWVLAQWIKPIEEL